MKHLLFWSLFCVICCIWPAVGLAIVYLLMAVAFGCLAVLWNALPMAQGGGQ